MKLIVGLGNPGKEYEKTRHNIGFMVLDDYLGNVKWSNKFNALYYESFVGTEKVIFVKPLTYMNNSGNAVGEFVRYYNIGLYKLKVNSSSGGHNGIKSIISSLGTHSFPRLKVGIGSVKKDEVIDYVLGKFSKKEMEILNNEFSTFRKIIESFVNVGIDKTMNVYNTK